MKNKISQHAYSVYNCTCNISIYNNNKFCIHYSGMHDVCSKFLSRSLSLSVFFPSSYIYLFPRIPTNNRIWLVVSSCFLDYLQCNTFKYQPRRSMSSCFSLSFVLWNDLLPWIHLILHRMYLCCSFYFNFLVSHWKLFLPFVNCFHFHSIRYHSMYPIVHFLFDAIQLRYSTLFRALFRFICRKLVLWCLHIENMLQHFTKLFHCSAKLSNVVVIQFYWDIFRWPIQ